MTTTPTILIESNDFHNAWARAVRSVLLNGRNITIGDVSEPKPIRDSCMTIALTGNAIEQIENREIHPQFPFKHTDQYCEEFTRVFHTKYMNLDDEIHKFSYTYIGRLINYPSRLYTQPNIDQLTHMRDHLNEEIESGISSNRHQSITWRPSIDILSNVSPCLQRIWIRYIGNHEVEVHLTWRSRDLYTAWQSNIIALIDMLNREVIKPNMCRIKQIVDYSDSLHVYKSDWEAAKMVNLVPTNPQTMR